MKSNIKEPEVFKHLGKVIKAEKKRLMAKMSDKEKVIFELLEYEFRKQLKKDINRLMYNINKPYYVNKDIYNEVVNGKPSGFIPVDMEK